MKLQLLKENTKIIIFGKDIPFTYIFLFFIFIFLLFSSIYVFFIYIHKIKLNDKLLKKRKEEKNREYIDKELKSIYDITKSKGKNG